MIVLRVLDLLTPGDAVPPDLIDLIHLSRLHMPHFSGWTLLTMPERVALPFDGVNVAEEDGACLHGG